jgi:hypothetical protein
MIWNRVVWQLSNPLTCGTTIVARPRESAEAVIFP